MSHKTWCTHDIITVAHKLRDYSLRQIAFAVFQALFVITQLLCQVSTLTGTCKQAFCVPTERLL